LLTTVLIAEPDQLLGLRERPEYAEALAFTDAQTPAALEAILINRPDIVVVERIFASKSRGAALINRIKADPSLEVCEIRIVTHDSGATRVAARQTTASSSGGTTTITAVVTTPAVLDQRGTRRAPSLSRSGCLPAPASAPTCCSTWCAMPACRRKSFRQ
jgi:hypothetical protein